MAKPKKTEYSEQLDRVRKLLISARKSRNLTQGEVARRLGRAQSFVAKYEVGVRSIDVAEFVAITKAIGIDPRKVIGALLRRWPEPPQTTDPRAT